MVRQQNLKELERKRVRLQVDNRTWWLGIINLLWAQKGRDVGHFFWVAYQKIAAAQKKPPPGRRRFYASSPALCKAILSWRIQLGCHRCCATYILYKKIDHMCCIASDGYYFWLVSLLTSFEDPSAIRCSTAG